MDDSTENYQGVYDQRLGFGEKPALILVDFVDAYFNKECDLYAHVDDALDAAQRLRQAAHEAGILVILTNVAFHPSMVDGGVFAKKARPLNSLKAGSKYGDWAPGLTPVADELIITKQYPSSFFGTSLSSTLTAAGIDTLIITGLTTSGCVRATCVDACSYGFMPIVVREGCGDRATGPHEANLFDMNAKYADVVSEKEALDYLYGLDK